MRLHIHPETGFGDGRGGSAQKTKEPIAMTAAAIISCRRIAVLEHGQRTKNMAATRRTFGISRTRPCECTMAVIGQEHLVGALRHQLAA